MRHRCGCMFLGAVLGLPACGSSDNALQPGGSAIDDASADARADAGDDSSTGTFVVPGLDSSIVLGTGTDGAALCAAESKQGELVPLDIYIMMDSSGSMTEQTGAPTAGGMPTGPTKWQAVSDALTAFVHDANSTGLGVGIGYFPIVRPGVPAQCMSSADCGQYGPCQLKACDQSTLTFCESNTDCPTGVACVDLGLCADGTACLPVGAYCNGRRNDPCSRITSSFCDGRDSCTTQDYATPAVEVGVLPGVAPMITASIGQRMPDGLTPTSAALTGAIDHARMVSASNPGHTVVVVLATDGLPTECEPVDIPAVAQIAAAGLTVNPRISTFVIGVFAPADTGAQANLDAIASAGGTGKAVVVNTSQNVTQAFLAALNGIRTGVLACEYKIPPPEAGRIDFGKVNVQAVSGSGSKSTLGYVTSASQCTSQGGWFYDEDPAAGAPTKILLCDASCTTVTSDPSTRIDLLFGCQTHVN